VDDHPAVAVIGTRSPSVYGARTAARLGAELAARGVLVVSGLAAGCDSLAMEAALRAGGETIGVLGTAINKVYPAKNRALFEQVKRHGALVSEYAPDAVTYPASFKERNRLISGLSLGVAVAEAPVRSGTRITVEYAVEQDRDVFVVPGNADAAAAAGCSDLLARGAEAVTGGADIVSKYEGRTDLAPYPVRAAAETAVPEAPARKKAKTPIKKEIDKPGDIVYIDLSDEIRALPPDQLAVMKALARPGMYADELTEAAKLPARSVMAALTTLELTGFVKKDGQRYARKK